VVRTSLDDIAASTAQDAVKDQVVANKATVDSDLMHGTTDLAHKLAQQGIGRRTAGGAQQVGLHAVCPDLLVSSSLAAQQGVGRETAWGAQQVVLPKVCHYLLVLWLHKFGLCSHAGNANKRSSLRMQAWQTNAMI
jgi:hypothetical protein